jgi:LacI family transcriptional regulator
LRELANPFFAPMLSSIEAVAARRGFLVVVGESGKSLKGEQLYLSRFLQLRISGIVVTPVASDMSHLTAARGRGTPVVAMARVWGDGDYVTGDNREGGRLVAQHFLERGHRRLGVVSPDEPDNTAIQGRVAGFREQLGSTFLAVPPQWDVRTHGATLEDGVEAADRILAHDARPSAIFAATDVQAIGMVRRLIARGIQVPQDIAVVGYDDIPFADYAPIPLSSVAVPVRRIGELAAEVLFDRLDGLNPETLRQIVLPPQLIVRASG